MLKLTKQDVPRAANLLTEAFFEDGLVLRMCPDAAGRAERVRPVFKFSAHMAVYAGEAWAHSTGMEGVALWLYSWRMECPPIHWLWFGGLNIRRRLGAEAYNELITVSDRIDRARDSVAPKRYLYLSTLGVGRAHQRQGVATALVADRIRSAAGEGLSTIVETNTTGALEFYRSVGFVERKAFRAAEMDYHVLEYKAK